VTILHVVDAFTSRPFSGNPAAVAVVDGFPPDSWMQAVAAEMNLAETAFVSRRGDGEWDLRWFTPTAEVDLCGHATLATATVVGVPARFHTRSGILTCSAGADGEIEMDFPADPPADTEEPPPLGDGRPAAWGRSRFDLLIEMTDEAAVNAFQPDLPAILSTGARGLIVTARATRDDADFVSRFFAPAVGVPEDPVTGSAHCALACWWADRLGRNVLTGWQASRRGGRVGVRLDGDRVRISGHAVLVSEVRLLAGNIV
jgi:predicted PhzF superfamily epimerase YddE/YHI9